MGLRLAAPQAKVKADSAGMEVSLLKQFVLWKDEVLPAINGTYVTASLAAEVHGDIRHELQQIDKRLERIEERCAHRLVCALQQKHVFPCPTGRVANRRPSPGKPSYHRARTERF